MLKKLIAITLAAAILFAGIPLTEEALGKSILSVEADADSYDTITVDEVEAIRIAWDEYGYVMKRNFNNSKQGRQCVKYAQRLLNLLVPGADLQIDGIIGSASVRICKKFQQQHGLVVDGIIGAKTQAKLISEAKKIAVGSSVSPEVKAMLDFEKAYAYAKKYFNTRNTKYNYYKGQNCSNYCAQVMVAAGLPTTSEFRNGTYAFINVDGLRRYMTSKHGVKYKANPSASDINVGDIVYTNNGGHVMFVMKKSGSKIYCSGNTNNRDEIRVSISLISGVLKTSELFG